jgi:AcrR family transcriptional regulator
MVRLSRAAQQARNRARVLAAARDEFAEHGFRDAKVDRIADRLELTRGVVYSNFPSKRALYFAVLAELAEDAPDLEHVAPGQTPHAALGALARAWVARLPFTDADEQPRLGFGLLPEIVSDNRLRLPFAQLMTLDAILLGLALERLQPLRAPRRRMVRVAEAVLMTLHGARQMAAAAPAFLDPFTVIETCEQLADLDLDDVWEPPHIPYIGRARPADAAWAPPDATDAVRDEPVALGDDGVVAVLGLHRLGAAEEAARAARPDDEITAVVVTGQPGELGPLARMAVAELCGCLRQAFPWAAWPRLHVVYDDNGAIAAAAGVTTVTDDTEVAVRIHDGRIISRADGRGAGHAAASTAATASPNPPHAEPERGGDRDGL